MTQEQFTEATRINNRLREVETGLSKLQSMERADSTYVDLSIRDCHGRGGEVRIKKGSPLEFIADTFIAGLKGALQAEKVRLEQELEAI